MPIPIPTPDFDPLPPLVAVPVKPAPNAPVAQAAKTLDKVLGGIIPNPAPARSNGVP